MDLLPTHSPPQEHENSQGFGCSSGGCTAPECKYANYYVCEPVCFYKYHVDFRPKTVFKVNPYNIDLVCFHALGLA